MVSPLVKSTFKEIYHSLGRYLAIFAIVGLGVSLFSGLRMAQPDMIRTGRDYIEQYELHDYRLLSTLGFTDEDVQAFAEVEGVQAAAGSVYTEFLWQQSEQSDLALIAHMLTPGINEPSLTAGRMPQAANECLGDAILFSEADLGKELTVSRNNDDDTLELLSCDSYTIVGIAASPLYLNFERGTALIGSGSLSGFVLIPEEGFEFEAYHEIYLRMEGLSEGWSSDYKNEISNLTPEMEAFLAERGDVRFADIHSEAMEEITDAEEELADGWETYRTERADAEKELSDAYIELTDGEQEYQDGLADFEQGEIDYADGLAEYQDGLADYEQGEKDWAEGLAEYQDGLAEYEDGEKDYAEGLAEYEDGLADYEQGEKDYAEGLAEYEDGVRELEESRDLLADAGHELQMAATQLEEGEASYAQLKTLYDTAAQMAAAMQMPDAGTMIALLQSGAQPTLNAMVDQALQAEGSSLDEFLGGWAAAEASLGAPLTEQSLSALQTQLSEARSAYYEGLYEYEQGEIQLAEGERELADAKVTLDDARKELDDAKAELADAAETLAEGRAELDDAKVTLIDAENELAEGRQELDDAKKELADAEIELADAREELDKAPAELADARKELDDGWAEYNDGLAEAEKEFADAEAELLDGEQELADAKEELAKLEQPDTYALTRSENVGYACFENDTSIVHAVSVVFPVFFFLVAALVCMTTMKRMVDEQRTQIGVLKALGYSNNQIIGKYLFYSGSAALLGGVTGYALGSWGLPIIIWEIYGMMYGFAPLEHVFDPMLASICFLAALACSMGATYLSCRVELTRTAAALIRPKTPKSGKRVFLEYITPLWKRLSFLRKVSVRNVLRYRSRLVMMMLGIGGCTALLITGFGLRDSLGSIVNTQFDEITLYDYAVSFTDPISADESDAYLERLGWDAELGLLVHSGSVDLLAEDGSKDAALVVPEQGTVEGFIRLKDGERSISFPKAGEVVLNRGLAEDLNLSAGDSVKLLSEENGTLQLTVADICDNYVGDYVFLSPENYASAPDYQTLYVHAREGQDVFEQGVVLSSHDDVSTVSINEATRRQVNNMLSRLDILVVVIVLFAAALAFIVLYNLTNINITERMREIATIKVLGFHQGETAAYVFREIRMLALAGSIVGIPMGYALHAFVMAQVQVDGMFFPTDFSPISYLISIALTILFTVLITNVMRPKLSRIDMAESLKSIE